MAGVICYNDAKSARKGLTQNMTMATLIDQTRPDQTRPDQHYARNSSLELLRIIAMFMILLHHCAKYGGFDFSQRYLCVNGLYLSFLNFPGLGLFANNLFVLISGFFLVKSTTFNIHRIFSLWVRVIFYSITIFIVCVLSGRINFQRSMLPKVMLPITTRQWWFISSYFILYILHPLLNKILRSLSKESCRDFVLLMLGMWSVILLVNESINFDKVINFICLYCTAGYIRLWEDDWGSWKYIPAGIMMFVVNFLAVNLLKYAGFNAEALGGKTIYPVVYLSGMMGALNFLGAVCMLLGFRKLNIKQNIAINIVASALMGVYMIHESTLLRRLIWIDIFRMSSYQNSPYLILYSLAVVVIVYVSCTLIELTRQKIFRTLSRGRLA